MSRLLRLLTIEVLSRQLSKYLALVQHCTTASLIICVIIIAITSADSPPLEAPVLQSCVVLYDFEGAEEDELTVTEGQIVLVTGRLLVSGSL